MGSALVEPEMPIASGRDADVYAVGAERVLRRYRAGGDVAPEAAVMAHVAAHGYPVPEVFAADGTDLIMERLQGRTLLAEALDGAVAVTDAAELLADLHLRLHALPGRVLHMDLHPNNVMVTPRGPMVIDWRNATEGPADLDVAVTALIFAQAAFWPDPALAALGRASLQPFLSNVGGRPFDELDRAVGIRRRDPNLTADERGNLDRAAALVRESAARGAR